MNYIDISKYWIVQYFIARVLGNAGLTLDKGPRINPLWHYR